MTEQVTLHPFEIAGLGLAPFRFVSINKNIYSACVGHSQPGGTCAFCGQGILYECVIRSHDGKVFTVGQDCVRKIRREDNRLATALQREIAKVAKEKRDAEAQARQLERERLYRQELDLQRQANDGLTDAEVAERDRKEAEDAARSGWIAKNLWLIEVLQDQPGEFCRSMVDSLERGPVSGLSNRCQSILKDIYGKSHGRRGSKKYDAAVEDFCNRTE